MILLFEMFFIKKMKTPFWGLNYANLLKQNLDKLCTKEIGI